MNDPASFLAGSFIIFLPATTKEVKKDLMVKQETLKGTDTILLVDDEDMIIDVGRQILASLGYMPLLAKSGKEAKLLRMKKNNVRLSDKYNP